MIRAYVAHQVKSYSSRPEIMTSTYHGATEKKEQKFGEAFTLRSWKASLTTDKDMLYRITAAFLPKPELYVRRQLRRAGESGRINFGQR